MPDFFSHGKLMISGEYLVLKGAEAMALACNFGQQLQVETILGSREIRWESRRVDGSIWFKAIFSGALEIQESTDHLKAEQLQALLHRIRILNPDRFESGYRMITRLDFPEDWGLGSSSTMICNLAKWAEVDAFDLSEHSFKGSGYDIAVGMTGSEVLYSYPPSWESFVWNPPFANQLFFVYLNSKQNSRAAIADFESKVWDPSVIDEISAISRKMANCHDLDEFQYLMVEHERILSAVLQQQTVKARLFPDYPYAIKSLGAWGGDFVMACGQADDMDYFRSLGYETILSYKEMIKN